MEATFEREIVAVTSRLEKATSQLEEKSRDSFKHLEDVSPQMQGNFDFHSEAAKVADEMTRIQCIVDKVSKAAERKEFYLLLEKAEDAIQEIERFHSSYSEVLPRKILRDLKNNIDEYTKSIKTLRKTIKNLSVIPSLENPTQTDRWIRELDDFSFALEGHLESLPYYQINEMYVSLSNFLKKYEQKGVQLSSGSGKPFLPDEKRNTERILESAKQLVTVAERAMANLLATQSAEAKAIERVHSKHELIDYTMPDELGSTIDVAKLNERLRKRGYNIQIPCEDPPTG